MNRSYEYDVVIVGGGTAGVAAATGATQAGARTLLIERNAYLGGEATHSGVAAFCGFFTCGGNPVKVVAGAGDMVIEELGKLGPTYDYVVSAAGNKNINFQQEYLKCALDNLMEAVGVDVLLHASVIGAEVEGRTIKALTCIDDEGEFTVHAKCFVDASGDANLVQMAGGKTLWGDEDGNVQAATLTFRLSGVDTTQPMTPNAVEKAVLRAKKEGILNLTRERGFVLVKEGSEQVTVLLPSVMPKSLDSRELTAMEKDTRRQVLSYVQALKTYMPGMERCELAVIGPSLGFRETRRMCGRKTVTAEDVLQRKKCEDGVARGGWKPEIHKKLNEQAVYLDVEEASYFDIPLGALQSENIDNLYGAGRLVSSDTVGFAAIRVMGTCFATGHGAGVAAALQALTGTADIKEVRKELEKQSALI